ncbi:organic cation transporter [Brachionus plicatilis]|uniref:Organic cation transporter n=1 Tax=Brachionus plicatilis TaxID=10195 RepID=A0A3M7QQ20_BRAPC|nr:organic cation transporter [Brachionus plicatilis]
MPQVFFLYYSIENEAMEVVGTSKRVTAASSIYYFYILGEFVVLILAYFVRNYQRFYLYCTALMCSFLVYFWTVPESPRWLMTKKKFVQAHSVFKKIARANKKNLNDCTELENLKLLATKNEKENELNDMEKMIDESSDTTERNLSALETLKIFFRSKKLLLRTLTIMFNWLTNSLVYYGISFNTSDLVGDPYFNFGLSIIVELIAIIVTHFTLERYGRKVPYSITMVLTGASLLCVLFVPPDMGFLVTACALLGKFSISFTYNTIYIITGESHPTVIRTSAISVCQTFARMGAIVAPNVQLLGELYWYPMPFVIFGACSSVSALLFIFFVPETKDKKLPDTIEDFINN